MSSPGQKRKFTGTTNDNGFKYSRPNDEVEQSHTQGKLDITFGQRSVFPGLDDYTLTGDDSLDHDDELGALSYLRSVREEATSIPTVLVAPKFHPHDRSIYEDGVGDMRGWYSQGAYTAAPLSATSVEEESSLSRDPQTTFYESLLSKYQALRIKLSQTPPQEVQEKLDLSSHPTHAKKSLEGEQEWNHRLLHNSPNSAQLALMTKWSVLRLLALMTTQDAVLRRGFEINQNTSLWLWGLLARVPERGEMNNEQIAIVRDLGKKAVLVSLGLKDAEDWNDGLDAIDAEMHGEKLAKTVYTGDSADTDTAATANISDSEFDSEVLEGAPFDSSIGPHPLPSLDAAGDASSDVVLTTQLEEDEIAIAKTRLLGNVLAPADDTTLLKEDTLDLSKNTKVTLDMVLTVVGEVYGQRDLLEFREKWDETEPSGTY